MGVAPQLPLFDSVWELVEKVKSGNSTDAVAGLWQRFYSRLVEFAMQELRCRQYAIKDPDDIATDTFYDFFTGARLGAFSKLNNCDDVWQILKIIASRRLVDLARSENSRKRGGGWRRVAMPPVECGGPSAEQSILFNDQLHYLLQQLPNGEHAEVAIMKISGFPLQVIADQLRLDPSTVESILDVIRETWQNEVLPGSSAAKWGGGEGPSMSHP